MISVATTFQIIYIYQTTDKADKDNSDALRDLVPFAQFKKREKHP